MILSSSIWSTILVMTFIMLLWQSCWTLWLWPIRNSILLLDHEIFVMLSLGQNLQNPDFVHLIFYKLVSRELTW
jgi:hypothetical protein